MPRQVACSKRCREAVFHVSGSLQKLVCRNSAETPLQNCLQKSLVTARARNAIALPANFTYAGSDFDPRGDWRPAPDPFIAVLKDQNREAWDKQLF